MKFSNGGKLKVLVISHLYPDEVFCVGGGSIGVFVREQLRALSSFCDLRVLIPRDCVPRRTDTLSRWWTRIGMLPKRFNDEGIELDVVRFAALPPRRHFLVGYGAAAFLPVLRRAQAIQREFAFDLIHAHTTVPDGIVAGWLGSIFGVPVVITSHQGDVERVPANQWNRATLRYALSRADRVVAVSEKLKEGIVAMGVPGRKVTMIPNGFDPAKFSIDGNSDARTNRKGPERVILFLGQLIPRKDPLILLQALKRLSARVPNVRLVMVGDGPLRREVREQVLQLGLTECVDLVGEVPHSRVPDYLRTADLMCLPSHSEGWPTVIFEALSMGVPVIASRVGGNPEAIYSDDFGLLVEPGDLEGLTEALYRGLTMAWDHEKIRRYAAGFTWGKIAERLHEEYRSLAVETRIPVHHADIAVNQ
jgi:glycosyltransferase involved in cell wall biosynthesis